jgi:hypothetical protein
MRETYRLTCLVSFDAAETIRKAIRRFAKAVALKLPPLKR